MEFWFSVCSKWAGELQKMRSHMVGQPGHYLLWISIAGMKITDLKHLKHSYLAPLMTDFHVPVMKFPLRNTNEVIKLAGLDSNDANVRADIPGAATNPSYSLPPHLMSGVQCQQIKLGKNSAGFLKTLDDAEQYGVPLPSFCGSLLAKLADSLSKGKGAC